MNNTVLSVVGELLSKCKMKKKKKKKKREHRTFGWIIYRKKSLFDERIKKRRGKSVFLLIRHRIFEKVKSIATSQQKQRNKEEEEEGLCIRDERIIIVIKIEMKWKEKK